MKQLYTFTWYFDSDNLYQVAVINGKAEAIYFAMMLDAESFYFKIFDQNNNAITPANFHMSNDLFEFWKYSEEALPVSAEVINKINSDNRSNNRENYD